MSALVLDAGALVAVERNERRMVARLQAAAAHGVELSPALLGERLWDAATSAQAYPQRHDFVRACVPILRDELARVRDAGADIIQIDDPHLCLFVDADVRAKFDDPVAESDFAVDVVNEILAGVEGRWRMETLRTSFVVTPRSKV